MRLRLAAFSLVTLAACGAEERGDEPLVAGRWTYERDGCFGVLDLQGETALGGSYEHVLTCMLESGDYGVQVVRGTYEAFPERLALTAHESTCPDQSPYSVSYPWRQDGRQLALEDRGGVWLLVADGSAHGPATGHLVYGCYGDSGTFAEHAVTAL